MSPLVITADLDGTAVPGLIYPAGPDSADVAFVFAHGAGAGQSSPFMRRYAEGLAGHGFDVVTFDFPYMAARRKMPDRPPVLEGAFRAVVDAVVAEWQGGPLALGGKSMGGRMATHLAAQPEAWTAAVPLAGAVALGYPLKPPGPRGGDRVSHLHRLAVPALIVQGTRDTFGGPDDIRAAIGDAPRIAIEAVPTGDHSLKVQAAGGRSQADTERHLVATMAAWMRGQVGLPTT